MANTGWRYLARRRAQHSRAALRSWRLRRRAGDTPSTGSEQLAATGRARRTPVRAREAVTLPRPPGLDAHDWRAMRIRDVDSLPEQFVLDVPDAVVHGGGGWVFVDGTLVDDLWQEVGFPSARMTRPPRSGAVERRLAGTTASLLLPWMPNYYHWTLQSVPRHRLLGEVLPDVADVDHWLVPPTRTRFVADWLDRLGIPADRRVEVSAPGELVRAERLVVASLPARNRHIPGWVVDDLRDRFSATGSRRVFIDRPETDKRRLLNRDEVLEVLQRNGFEIVQLGGLAVAEQAELFASAEVVAAVLGAGLTNLVYCRPGTRVVEILPRNLVFPAYLKLSLAAGLDYRSVPGTEPRLPWPLTFPDTEADVVADVAALEAALLAAVAASGAAGATGTTRGSGPNG